MKKYLSKKEGRKKCFSAFLYGFLVVRAVIEIGFHQKLNAVFLKNIYIREEEGRRKTCEKWQKFQVTFQVLFVGHEINTTDTEKMKHEK